LDAALASPKNTGILRWVKVKLQLGWGKLRRQYLVLFRPGYVQSSLERRRGECDRSGACCVLMYHCAFLREDADQPGCRIYRVRPKVCSVFPIDERDLRDRDLIMPDHPCGFSFVPEGVTAPVNPPARPSRVGYVNLLTYHEPGTAKEVRTHAQ